MWNVLRWRLSHLVLPRCFVERIMKYERPEIGSLQSIRMTEDFCFGFAWFCFKSAVSSIRTGWRGDSLSVSSRWTCWCDTQCAVLQWKSHQLGSPYGTRTKFSLLILLSQQWAQPQQHRAGAPTLIKFTSKWKIRLFLEFRWE